MGDLCAGKGHSLQKTFFTKDMDDREVIDDATKKMEAEKIVLRVFTM